MRYRQSSHFKCFATEILHRISFIFKSTFLCKIEIKDVNDGGKDDDREDVDMLIEEEYDGECKRQQWWCSEEKQLGGMHMMENQYNGVICLGWYKQ